jgi:hypothetical protein
MKLLGFVAALAVFLLPALTAQDATALFKKAPPEVDEALRKSAGEFFEMQVGKKYGAAIKHVSEESLDTYIGSEKDLCFSIDIMGITYNESFDDAIVTILCERGMATPVGGGRVTMPTTTYWRVENGAWKWYTPKDPNRKEGNDYVMTPFGPVPTRTPDMDESGKVDRKDVKLTPQVTLDQLQTALKLNPEKVVMRADQAATVTAEVHNTFPGLLKVAVRWVGMKGLTATIDREEINADEKATITVKYEPQGIAPPPKVHAVWVETNPMRSATPLLIEFRYEEELEAQPESKTGQDE